MFKDTRAFNQTLLHCWNVDKVANISMMFSNANEFNQDLSNWNVENVEIFQICLMAGADSSYLLLGSPYTFGQRVCKESVRGRLRVVIT